MRTLQVISPRRTRSRRRLVKTMRRVYCKVGTALIRASHPFSPCGNDNLTGDPASIVSGQECGGDRNILRLANSTERIFPVLPLSKFTLVEPGSAQALSFHHARIKRVHADFTWAQLLRKRNRNCVYRSFACTVGRCLRRWHWTNNRADVDDGPTLRPDQFDRFLCGQQ